MFSDYIMIFILNHEVHKQQERTLEITQDIYRARPESGIHHFTHGWTKPSHRFAVHLITAKTRKCSSAVCSERKWNEFVEHMIWPLLESTFLVTRYSFYFYSHRCNTLTAKWENSDSHLVLASSSNQNLRVIWRLLPWLQMWLLSASPRPTPQVMVEQVQNSFNKHWHSEKERMETNCRQWLLVILISWRADIVKFPSLHWRVFLIRV